MPARGQDSRARRAAPPAKAKLDRDRTSHQASLPLLTTKSGHTSIRSLGKYARPGAEALAAWRQQTDRTRRGRG